MYVYTVAVGYFDPVNITIRAKSTREAFDRAQQCMDTKYRRWKKEGPVAWDLAIVSKSKQR
jgi:hypothetical protein